MDFLDENLIWTCKDGRKVHLHDMETQHLHNSIQYLKRKTLTEKLKGMIRTLEGEQRRRKKLNLYIPRGEYQRKDSTVIFDVL